MPNSPYIELKEIEDLIRRWGGLTSLDKIQGVLKTKISALNQCPHCKGLCEVTKLRDPHPQDYGHFDPWIPVKATCDLCKGVGHTEKLMAPKMVQQGWIAQ